MNYTLTHIPERTQKPRDYGFTMVMDKGLSVREAEDFIASSEPYTDIVKLGWATSYVTPNLRQKLKVCRDAGVPVYFGGTLFEAFIVRNMFDDYRRLLDEFDMHFAEVSDGSIELPHEQKCEYIHTLAKQVTVLSEVGSKDGSLESNRRSTRSRQRGLVPGQRRSTTGLGAGDSHAGRF